MTGKTTLQYQWLLGIRHWRLRCRMGNSYVSLGHRTGPSSHLRPTFKLELELELAQIAPPIHLLIDALGFPQTFYCYCTTIWLQHKLI